MTYNMVGLFVIKGGISMSKTSTSKEKGKQRSNSYDDNNKGIVSGNVVSSKTSENFKEKQILNGAQQNSFEEMLLNQENVQEQEAILQIIKQNEGYGRPSTSHVYEEPSTSQVTRQNEVQTAISDKDKKNIIEEKRKDIEYEKKLKKFQEKIINLGKEINLCFEERNKLNKKIEELNKLDKDINGSEIWEEIKQELIKKREQLVEKKEQAILGLKNLLKAQEELKKAATKCNNKLDKEINKFNEEIYKSYIDPQFDKEGIEKKIEANDRDIELLRKEILSLKVKNEKKFKKDFIKDLKKGKKEASIEYEKKLQELQEKIKNNDEEIFKMEQEIIKSEKKIQELQEQINELEQNEVDKQASTSKGKGQASTSKGKGQASTSKGKGQASTSKGKGQASTSQNTIQNEEQHQQARKKALKAVYEMYEKYFGKKDEFEKYLGSGTWDSFTEALTDSFKGESEEAKEKAFKKAQLIAGVYEMKKKYSGKVDEFEEYVGLSTWIRFTKALTNSIQGKSEKARKRAFKKAQLITGVYEMKKKYSWKKNKFEEYVGKGTWDSFSKALNTSIRGKSEKAREMAFKIAQTYDVLYDIKKKKYEKNSSI